jgi:hypothetical protein
MGSVALPAVLRAGESAQNQFTTGSMQKAQFSQVSNQAHSGGQLSMAVSDPACTHPVLVFLFYPSLHFCIINFYLFFAPQPILTFSQYNPIVHFGLF